MIKLNKNLISTYISLDSKKADEYLARIANDFFKDLEGINDNEQIIESLDIIAEFAYKVPNQIIDIVGYLAVHPINSKIIKSPFGKYESKSHVEVIAKTLDLLDRIRYIHSDGVLPILAQFSLSEEKVISTKAREVLKHFAKYDFNVLTKSEIGYGAQKKALDFVMAWSTKDQLQHIDFVETVLKELLSTSVEGTTSGLNENADYTLTMHFGVVSPTIFLKEIRRAAIDLVYKLYQSADDPKLKLRLVEILDETGRTPSNVSYGEDVVEMITDDLKYLVNIYRKIIFDKGRMTNFLGIVATIEERLYWINRGEKKQLKELEQLRQDILSDKLYKVFRLLAGDPMAFRKEEGWNAGGKKLNGEIDMLINSLESSKIGLLSDQFNKIAEQHIIIDDWKFNTFKYFLRKVSEIKPRIADALFENALKNNLALKHFAGSFLDGFRIGDHFALWDKYAAVIISIKDSTLVSAIVSSLNLPPDSNLEKKIRGKDIDFLGAIAKRKGQFSFLQETADRTLQYALFNTSMRNFERSPEKIEEIIVEELTSNSDCLEIFFSELPMAIHRKWIDINDLRSTTIDFLLKKMVGLSSIDWYIQELLLKIGEQYGLKSILSVFIKRIQQDAKNKKKREWLIGERYEVIPYHFNPDLSKFITEHSAYIELASKMVDKMTIDWSIYNWNIALLLQRLGRGFDEIIMSLIRKGDDDSLTKAVGAMHSIEGSNFGLSIEIVRRTDNKQILNQIEGNMYATGVVSGEYGISEAYEKKAKALKKYLVDKDKRVKTFASKMIESFLKNSEKERRLADEEKQLRKIEFED
jgi:hypothetical protein